MAIDADERVQLFALINQARELLDQFARMEPDDRKGSSELVVELQAVLDEFRRVCPPATFRRQRE